MRRRVIGNERETNNNSQTLNNFLRGPRIGEITSFKENRRHDQSDEHADGEERNQSSYESERSLKMSVCGGFLHVMPLNVEILIALVFSEEGGVLRVGRRHVGYIW